MQTISDFANSLIDKKQGEYEKSLNFLESLHIEWS